MRSPGWAKGSVRCQNQDGNTTSRPGVALIRRRSGSTRALTRGGGSPNSRAPSAPSPGGTST